MSSGYSLCSGHTAAGRETLLNAGSLQKGSRKAPVKQQRPPSPRSPAGTVRRKDSDKACESRSLPTLRTCDEPRALLSGLSLLGWEGAEAAASPAQGCAGYSGNAGLPCEAAFFSQARRPGLLAATCTQTCGAPCSSGCGFLGAASVGEGTCGQ